MELKPCELNRLFAYDATTGILRWKVSTGNRVKAGEECGSIDSKGRRRVLFRGKTYAVHQLVFAMHHGRWSIAQVDHIDGDKLNNRIENLREATNAQNARNRLYKNRTKPRGVSMHKRDRRYHARIMVDGRSMFLGSFDNAERAAHEYNKAAVALHGDFAVLNPIGRGHD